MDWCACYACAPVLTHVQCVSWRLEAQRANVANGLKKMGTATGSHQQPGNLDSKSMVDYGLLRRQHVVEKIAGLLLLACAAVSVITTVGIIVIPLLTEALRFFATESVVNFLFSSKWTALFENDQSFGVLSLVSATVMITVLSMLLAIPMA